MDLNAIQSALHERNIDAWLFYDHHHRDSIAYRVLGLPEGSMVTRRWFYIIPREGEPTKLVHRIEAGRLDSLPGAKREYSSWRELWDNLQAMLVRHRRVHVALDDHRLALLGHRLAGQVEGEQGLVFVKQECVARVEVLWRRSIFN